MPTWYNNLTLHVPIFNNSFAGFNLIDWSVITSRFLVFGSSSWLIDPASVPLLTGYAGLVHPGDDLAGLN